MKDSVKALLKGLFDPTERRLRLKGAKTQRSRATATHGIELVLPIGSPHPITPSERELIEDRARTELTSTRKRILNHGYEPWPGSVCIRIVPGTGLDIVLWHDVHLDGDQEAMTLLDALGADRAGTATRIHTYDPPRGTHP